MSEPRALVSLDPTGMQQAESTTGTFKVSLTAGAVGAVQSADGTRGRLVASVSAGDGAPWTFVESLMLSSCASVLATAGEGAER